MYFPSKRDWWLGLILLTAVFLPLIMTLWDGGEEVTLLFSIPVALLVGWIWFDTGYTITDEELKIKSGPIRFKIRLESIQSIKKSMNPLSSPALSLDRFKVSYGEHGIALVSPKDKRGFVEAIRERNPAVEIDERLTER